MPRFGVPVLVTRLCLPHFIQLPAVSPGNSSGGHSSGSGERSGARLGLDLRTAQAVDDEDEDVDDDGILLTEQHRKEAKLLKFSKVHGALTTTVNHSQPSRLYSPPPTHHLSSARSWHHACLCLGKLSHAIELCCASMASALSLTPLVMSWMLCSKRCVRSVHVIYIALATDSGCFCMGMHAFRTRSSRTSLPVCMTRLAKS